MKKIKYILFTAVILSFFFITACSTTKSVPQDDVYYSTTPHNNVTAKTTATNAISATAAKQTGNTGYKQGKVENISKSSGKTTSGDQYDVDYSAQLKRFHQSNDTSLDYYDNYYADKTTQDTSQQNTTTTVVTTPSVTFNLGFGSPYFGSSWSFGFSSYGWGMSYGWGSYPYYGYGWGYPYYGYPYYGYSGWGYPGWGYYPGYYPSYYPGYPDYGYRAGIYQPRINRGGGSSVSRGTVAGSSGVYSPNTKSAGRAVGAVYHKRVPVNPEGRNGKMIKPNSSNSRPAGSIRFSPELAKKRLEENHTQGKLNKPAGSAVRRNPNGNRSTRFGVSESRNQRVEGYRRPPAYQREESMKLRFQKPKQYQSLESRSMRSSKEFYRSPVRTSNPEYRRTGTRTVRPQPQTVRRQNIYRPRPAGSRNSIYRSNSRDSGVKVYSTPTRSFSSPNSFRTPAYRNSSRSKPSGSFRAPTRSFSAPVRISTGSSGSGGGGVRRSSSSGGIRR